MLTWVLILFFYGSSGPTITNVQGFISFEECQNAGIQARQQAMGTPYQANFSCVQQTK